MPTVTGLYILQEACLIYFYYLYICNYFFSTFITLTGPTAQTISFYFMIIYDLLSKAWVPFHLCVMIVQDEEIARCFSAPFQSLSSTDH